MDRILQELNRRDLPYTITEHENGSVILFAMGYTPFLYQKNQFEIDAFYLASNKAYNLCKSLAGLVENATPSPNVNYKAIAEKSGLGVRGKNDLIFTQKFGSLCTLGAVFVDGVKTTEKLVSPEIPCNVCGKCVQKCPTCALKDGFCRPLCLRDQFDKGLDQKNIPLLSKSILGCNICSTICPKNKFEPVLPPRDFSDFLIADNFFDKAIKGRREMSLLGDYIGTNYVRPSKLLTFAVYSINNVECDRERWLEKLKDYPDERVRVAAQRMKDDKN